MSPDRNTITQSDLESYLWGAAVLLRGLIDAGDYKQFIFPLLFFKRVCDIYDEESTKLREELGDDVDEQYFPKIHRFQIPRGAHWRDVRETTTHVGRAIQEAMRAIESTNPWLYGIFGDAPWTNTSRLPDRTLSDSAPSLVSARSSRLCARRYINTGCTRTRTCLSVRMRTLRNIITDPVINS